MSKINSSELLGRVFSFIAIQNHPNQVWFPDDNQIFHPLMMKLAKKYQKSFLKLNHFHFVERGAFPYSHELTDVMDMLKQSGILISVRYGTENFFVPSYCDDSLKALNAWKQKNFANKKEKPYEEFMKFAIELFEGIPNKRFMLPILET